MLIEKVNMIVTNVNQRKEGSGEGMVLATDVKGTIEVPRAFMDRVVPDQDGKFSSQFFTDSGDTRLQQVYPINVKQKLEDMSVGIYFGNKPTNFRPATVTGISMSPMSGGYVSVELTLQVHPTQTEAGKLDMLIKEVVAIEVDSLTADIEDDDAGAEAGNSE